MVVLLAEIEDLGSHDGKVSPIGRVGRGPLVTLRLPRFRQTTRRVLQRPSAPPVIDRIQGRHQAFRPRPIVLVAQIRLHLPGWH